MSSLLAHMSKVTFTHVVAHFPIDAQMHFTISGGETWLVLSKKKLSKTTVSIMKYCFGIKLSKKKKKKKKKKKEKKCMSWGVFAHHSFGITKSCLYSFDPLKPHFHTVKLEFTGVYYIFLFFCSKT